MEYRRIWQGLRSKWYYNLTIDGLSFSGKTNSGGEFVAQSKDAEFYNIHLKNYNDLNYYDFGNGQNTFGGLGVVGYANSGSKFENIILENFGTITLTQNGILNFQEIKSYLGGFAGVIDRNKLDIENISLNNFGDIESKRGVTMGINYNYRAAADGFF